MSEPYLTIFDDSDLDAAQHSFFRYVLDVLGSWTRAHQLQLCCDREDMHNPQSSFSVHDPDLTGKLTAALHKIDCVLTNSINPAVRAAHDFVLNIGVGIYSRPPMPQYFSVDPLGLYQDSLAYQAPWFEFRRPDKIKSGALKQKVADLVAVPDQYQGIALFPWHSDTKVLRSFLSQEQFTYFQQFDHDNHNVYWTQKPPTQVWSQPVESSVPDPRLPSHRYIPVDTAMLVPGCEKIHVFHSTLGFQAALWGKPIESPGLFGHWHGDQTDTIEALLDLTWFSNRDEFFSVLNNLSKWRTMNRCAVS